MGFFDRLSNAFNKFFGTIFGVKFDDKDIIDSINNCPQSLSEKYKKSLNEIAENIHQVYATANNKEFTIGIIGDFTVGKSTFVNAILGDRLLPVFANPTTAIITKIKYGRKPKVIIRYKDGDEEEMTYEAFMKFSAFNLNDFQERMTEGDIQRFKNVVNAEMYVKSEFLKVNNLCIVDTLGLSAHESDNEKTIASIRDSIATIYLCAERGLSNKDVDFITTYLSPERDDFFMCINRIDLVKKSERGDLSQLVKLKMDDILGKMGHAKKFPLSRIYLVSSLYQEFANGFTDHDDWRKGINYQEQSGFLQVMNDVYKHVKTNADTSRKEAISGQLRKSQLQLAELMELRKSELNGLISTNISKILNLNNEITRNQETVNSINLLFQKLFNEISSFSKNLYQDFFQCVDKGWGSKLNSSFVNQVSFGFRDYWSLKHDIFLLKLNIFKSMSDDRYAKLDSLSQFVEPTLQFLKDNLRPIIFQIESQIKIAIEKFVKANKFNDYFDEELNFGCEGHLSIEQTNVVSAIYRAVALAAVETMWIRRKNRRIKMFNAAKTEALKSVEKPLKNKLEEFFDRIKQYLNNCNANAIAANVRKIETLTLQVKELELQNSLLSKQRGEEALYFDGIIALLSNSMN